MKHLFKFSEEIYFGSSSKMLFRERRDRFLRFLSTTLKEFVLRCSCESRYGNALPTNHKELRPWLGTRVR